MGVRPPSNGDGDAPDSIEFGIAALDGHLERAEPSFPATAREVVESLGDPTVDYDPHGNGVALSTAVERAEVERFESRQEFLDALHPVFEDLRRSTGAGLVGWVRSLLPGR